MRATLDRRTVRASACALAVALGGAGCEARRAESAQCVYSDQCAAGLVCAGGTCRAACSTDRDCTAGARCLPAGRPEAHACVPPDAPVPCVYASDCAPGLVCARDGLCHAQCVTARDCAVRAPWLANADCHAGVCELAARPPRQRAPLSGALMGSGTVRLRWFGPANNDLVRLELCADSPCNSPQRTLDQTPAEAGNESIPVAALTPGVWFWRVRRIANGLAGPASPWWEFTMTGGRRPGGGMTTNAALYADDDDYADLAFSAPGFSARRGEVDLYPGSPTGLGTTALTPRYPPNPALSQYGSSMASVGDLDGDGNGDLVVAAPGDPQVYLLAGSPTGLPIAVDPTFRVVSAGVVGVHIASAGDVHRDGRADLLVGWTDATRTSPTVVVLRGAPAPAFVAPASSVPRPDASTDFGAALAGAGDVNGDGFGDVVIAAPAGLVAYVFLGTVAGLAPTPAATLRGDPSIMRFGVAVASAGDLDGDGYAEVAVLDRSMSDASQLWIFRGGAGGVASAASAVLPLPMPAVAATGVAVIALGDANGDGYGDLATSVVDEGGTGSGRVVVWYGGPRGLSTSATMSIAPPAGSVGNSEFGFALGAPSDVDGDGFAELAVGAPGDHVVYVYRGSARGYDAATFARASGGTGSTTDLIGAAFPH